MGRVEVVVLRLSVDRRDWRWGLDGREGERLGVWFGDEVGVCEAERCCED